jgi:hypothetical protein
MTIYFTLTLLGLMAAGLVFWGPLTRKQSESTSSRKVFIYTGVERRARRRYEPVF